MRLLTVHAFVKVWTCICEVVCLCHKAASADLRPQHTQTHKHKHTPEKKVRACQQLCAVLQNGIRISRGQQA